MVRLNCAVVGEGSVISVAIEDWKKVALLKKEIKDQSDELIKAHYPQLRLFLAKKNDAWLDWAGLAAVTLDGNRHPQGFKEMNPTLSVQNGELFGENFQPGEDQVHVLVVVPDGVPMPGDKRKREDPPDYWMQVIGDTEVGVLPSSEDLKEYLERELPVKIPLGARLFQIVTAGNSTGKLSSVVHKTFEPEPSVILSDVTASIAKTVIDPEIPKNPTTENAYIRFWDNLIAGVLDSVSDGDYRRNTNHSASTGESRPDLCYYVYGRSKVCVFRGEERARGDLSEPIGELHSKLTWKYDDAPYIFGYAAVGFTVCLVAIMKDEKKSLCKSGCHPDIRFEFTQGPHLIFSRHTQPFDSAPSHCESCPFAGYDRVRDNLTS